jgi:hypothetical protein
VDWRLRGPKLSPYYPSVKDLNLPADCLLLATQTVGVEYPNWKKVVEGILSTVVTLGNRTGWESNNTLNVLTVISPDGVVLWEDFIFTSFSNYKNQSVVV